MKKTILILSAFLVLTACSSAPDASDTKEETKPKTSYPDQLKNPEKIDEIKVGSCTDLYNEMKPQYANLSDDEIYRAAAVILFADSRKEDAIACCDNITDPNSAQECKNS